jgi:threonine/homoserine/homoserine lactone efflux protein
MRLVITILGLGLLASLSPSTIVVFILVLATTRARLNAAAFLIGWGASLTIVFAVSYELGGSKAIQRAGQTTVDIIEIVVGLLLGFVAAREWGHRNRPQRSSSKTKSVANHHDQLSPGRAAIVGVLKQPWTLTTAAAVVVVRAHSAFPVVLSAFLVFTILSTATVGVIFLYFTRRPREAEAHLSVLRDRLVRAGPAIVAIVSVVVGVYLVIAGAIGIAGQ